MKGIEIPFGAKDSELCGWEYTIPEGMEAVVEGGKVIVRRKESEMIIDCLNRAVDVKYISLADIGKCLAYIEKRKEEIDRRREMVEQHCKNVDELGEKIKSLQKKLYGKQKEQKPRTTEETELNSIAFLEQMGYTCIPPGKEQKPVARENDFVNKPQTSVEILRHYLVWAGSSEEDCPYTWKTLADAIRDGIKALEEKKPAEWSEEDELMRSACITFIKDKKFKGYERSYECIDWLKSLRSRPKSSDNWKPSEEQMDALNEAVGAYRMEDTASCEKTADILESLYSDLQKQL